MWRFGRRPGRASRGADIGALLVPEAFGADPVLRTACEAVREGEVESGLPLLAESREAPELRVLRAVELGRAAADRPGGVAALVESGADRADAVLWLGYALLARIPAGAVGGAGASTAERKAASAALHEAGDALEAAAGMRPDDAAPWEGLQTVATGLDADREDKDRIWREIIARAPHLFPAHMTRVRALRPPPGESAGPGAAEEMFAFAGSVADTAPEGSPLPAVLALAHAEHLRRERDRLRGEGNMDFIVDGAMGRLYGEAVQELFAFARDWVARAVPHLRDAQAHHLFGWAFHKAEMTEAARWHLSAVGGLRCDLPWSLFGRASTEAGRAMAELGVDPARDPGA
ncbi:hypothetical protein HNR06_001562 [Nocardiopsis arvandica]|uniref:DUF4034 domain-containing protein n=1 Tax=Nocardiopsis sinuspersici TaxID=501010 RepID=A0A7Y9XCE5_9ACTN|nr:hypothetical protein [Nocardiopsis sinuspersici]NYH51973.1 hypothetical protein [Nocardiopsis sinuspersici]